MDCTCTSKGEISTAIELGKSAHKRLDEHKDRMDKLEENNDILHEMNTNIKLMVQQNGYRDLKVDTIEKDVKTIKTKPSENREKIKWIIVGILVSSLMVAVIQSLPLIITNLVK